MGYSTALTDKVTALREDYEKLIGKDDPTPEDLEAAKQKDAELDDLEAKMAEAQRLEQKAQERKKSEKTALRLVNTAPQGEGAMEKAWNGGQKSWFDEFVESAAFKMAMQSGDYRSIRVELPGRTPFIQGRAFKAAGDPILSSQFATRATDLSLLGHPFAPLGVIDLINVVNVTAANIRYYQAGTFTGTADFIAEGTLKPEVQPRWTPVDAPIETVADWTAVTLQALDDIPQLRSVIDFDLRMAVETKVNNSILNGSGTSPQIRGILNTSGIQTVAFVTSTSAPDMIAKGIAAVNATGQGVANAVVMNPTDWYATRTSKATGSGVYYFGSPSDTGVSNIFGLPVVVDSALAAGNALVGDFRMATIYQRMGITFIVGLKNDDLIKNLQTIVCEERLTLAVRRPAAFAKVALV